MAKVSVIIPTYNSADYITRSVESVLSQTYQDWRLYVVDDGSTDKTQDVLEPYSDRITYIYQDNAGPAKARNTGLKASEGEYIAFLDADDLWVVEKLELQVNFLDSHSDIQMIFSDNSLINGKGEVMLSGNPRKKQLLEMPFEILELNNRKFKTSVFTELLEGTFLQTSSVMIRRECINEIGYFDESLINGQDLDMWLRISLSYQLGFTDKILAKYRVHDSNFSVDSERRFSSTLKLLDKIASYPDLSDKAHDMLRSKYASTHFDYGYFYFYQDDFVSARTEFLKSFKYNYTSFKLILFLLVTCLPKNFITKIREWKGNSDHDDSHWGKYAKIRDEQRKKLTNFTESDKIEG